MGSLDSPHPGANVVVASLTPDVVWHLKADDEDAEVQLPGTLPQGMRALELVEPPLAWVIVGGVVLVDTFPLTLRKEAECI